MAIYEIGETPTLSVCNYDSNGNPADATAASLTITLPDGTTAGPFTGVHGTTGVYSYGAYTLVALGRHKLVWTFTGSNPGQRTQALDVYGATVCDPSDLRRWDVHLDEKVTFLDADIREAIAVSVERLHKRMRCSTAPFVSSFTKIDLGSGRVILPHAMVRAILSVKVDGVALDLSRIRVDYTAGVIALRQSVSPGAQVVVRYEHGMDTPPAETARIVAMLVHDKLVPPASGPRATSVTTDTTYVRLSMPGRDGSTGIPEVDAFIAEYGVTTAFGFA